MNGITLVISDIDGTLITSNHELTAATRQAADELRANRIGLSLASSRPPRAVVPIAAQLGLVSTFAAFNGALISTSQGETLAESTIAPETSARVKVIANELDLDIWLYDRRDWWAGRKTAFVEREEHTTGFDAVFEGYSQQLERPLNKLTMVGSPDRVAIAEQLLKRELGQTLSASRSKPRFLDITSYGWHKGSVVGRLASLSGTSVSQVAVIGDGPNDIEMFRVAGLSIAMGQAVDEVRASALFVTASNDDEGWAIGISKYVLGNSKLEGGS